MCKDESLLLCEHTFLCLYKIAEKLLVIADKRLIGLSSATQTKCHLTQGCHCWVCGSGRCCSTAWLTTLALRHASMACQPNWQRKHFMNFTGIDWLLHWARRSISTSLCCLSQYITAVPSLRILAYWSLDHELHNSIFTFKINTCCPLLPWFSH